MAGDAKMRRFVALLVVAAFAFWYWAVPVVTAKLLTPRFFIYGTNIHVSDSEQDGIAAVDIQRTAVRDFEGHYLVHVHKDTVTGPAVGGCTARIVEPTYAGSPPAVGLTLRNLVGSQCRPGPGSYIMTVNAEVPTTGWLWLLTRATVSFRLTSNQFRVTEALEDEFKR